MLKASESQLPKGRGRLRRRERRKNASQPKKLTVSKREDEVLGVQETSLRQSRHESWPRNTTDSERWPYDSGEIGVKDRTNQFPAALILDIDSLEPYDSPDDSFSQRYSKSDPNDTGQNRANLPTITIKSTENHGRQVSSPNRFHLISFYREQAPNDEDDIKDNDGSIYNYKPPRFRDSQVHVADLIDEVGFVNSKGYHSQGFISVIDCNPGAFVSSVASALVNQSPTAERNVYWQKFAALLLGFPSASSDFVDLPYSQGYGVSHNHPTLYFRQNRWGYLDVDNVSRDSKRPRWRAAWKFEVRDSSYRRAIHHKIISYGY